MDQHKRNTQNLDERYMPLNDYPGDYPDSDLTYKESKRNEAKEKRHKDQMSVTIFGIFVYSIVLIAIVVSSYVGFKSIIVNYKDKQAKRIEKERLEEAEARAEEEARLRAEEEAKKAALEEQEAVEEEPVEEIKGYRDLVFSVIENVSDPGNAPINSFDFARKALSSDEKLMDYEVYRNPEDDSIAKVTTRENCGDLYEITDYYYYKGKVNYIAQYREDTDVPVDISGGKIESRFYFDNDEMMRYIYCDNDKAVEYSSEDFDLYSEGTVDQYKYMEDMMLASSKTAFKNATDLKEEVIISGYILDELNCAPNDSATVELLDKNEKVVDVSETNGDGHYAFVVKANDSAEYSLSITGRDDMIPTKVYGIKAKRGTKSVDVDTVYLAYSVYDTIYPVQIFVKDADDANIAIAGAEVRFRYGLNNKDGEVFLSGILGDAGEIMPSLRSGNYTMEVSKQGYETCYVPFVVKEDHSALVAYAVKDVKDGSYKCVLTYETTPLDLDMRAFDTYGRNVVKSNTDSVGVTMAETIALSDLDSGTYTFYVSNYTDVVASDMMSYKLSQSGAKLYLYSADGLLDVFSVPAGHAGVVWRPFEIRNHNILTINDYYAYIVDDSIFKSK